jgi:hypothetical protein
MLASSNPIATPDQIVLEDRALRLFRAPAMDAARRQAGHLWRGVIRNTHSAEALSMLESAVEEYAFNYLMKAVNSDAAHPSVFRIFMPPHRWFGRDLPGSRLGGDNPDNCYRIVPVEAGGRYEVEGRFLPDRPADTTITLVGNTATSRTIQTLEGADLRVEGDGRFRITVDNDPANGRPNHLTNTHRGLYLFIRDSMTDWAKETPPELTVRQLGTQPRPPIDDETILERAVWTLVGDVAQTFWWQWYAMAREPNTMDVPYRAVTTGGLVSQISSKGFWRLGDDDALVITVSDGGAAYFSLVAHDCYYRTIDYPHRSSTLNLKQLEPDPDGRYTYVVAHRDPGVHNWIDTGGLHDLIANHRWQGLPAGGEAPTLEVRRSTLGGLERDLPRGVVRISPEERAAQLAGRLAAFNRRLAER